NRSVRPGRGDPAAREAVMLAPGLPDQPRPATDRGRVLLRRDGEDVGDRDFSADVRDVRLFQVTRAGEPSLDALVRSFTFWSSPFSMATARPVRCAASERPDTMYRSCWHA